MHATIPNGRANTPSNNLQGAAVRWLRLGETVSRRAKTPDPVSWARSGARGRIINHIHSHAGAASVKTPSARQRIKSKI